MHAYTDTYIYLRECNIAMWVEREKHDHHVKQNAHHDLQIGVALAGLRPNSYKPESKPISIKYKPGMFN